MFAISGFMLVASTFANLISGYDPGRNAIGQTVHLVAQAIALLGWLLGRQKRPLSPQLLAAGDAALTISLCAAWAMIGVGSPKCDPVEFTITLATTYTLILRALMVPSTFLRTLVISGVAIVPAFVFFLVRQAPFSPEGSLEERRIFVIFAGLWLGIAALTAAAHSRTLFGLRERIREIRKLGQYTLAEKIREGAADRCRRTARRAACDSHPRAGERRARGSPSARARPLRHQAGEHHADESSGHPTS